MSVTISLNRCWDILLDGWTGWKRWQARETRWHFRGLPKTILWEPYISVNFMPIMKQKNKKQSVGGAHQSHCWLGISGPKFVPKLLLKNQFEITGGSQWKQKSLSSGDIDNLNEIMHGKKFIQNMRHYPKKLKCRHSVGAKREVRGSPKSWGSIFLWS